MKIRYDRQGYTLDIIVMEGQIHHAEEHGQIIVNYDENGSAVEVEILKAPKREVVELI